MKRLVTLLISGLFIITVVSGLMTFLLPFDMMITRFHAFFAPLFSFFVLSHLYNNRKLFLKHLDRKHIKVQISAAAFIALVILLVLVNAYPVRMWLDQSYEKRQADIVFRPASDIVTEELRGQVNINKASDKYSLSLSADMVLSDEDSYVVFWIEDDNGSMSDTLFLSAALMFEEKVQNTDLSRGDLLPVWHHRWQKQKRELKEIASLDAVSGATQTVSTHLDHFYLMMEVGQAGQASQIYSLHMDMDKVKKYQFMEFQALGNENGNLIYDQVLIANRNHTVEKVMVVFSEYNKNEYNKNEYHEN